MFTLVLGQKPLLCYAAFPTSTAVQHANIIATYARPRCPCSACSRLPAREVAAGNSSGNKSHSWYQTVPYVLWREGLHGQRALALDPCPYLLIGPRCPDASCVHDFVRPWGEVEKQTDPGGCAWQIMALQHLWKLRSKFPPSCLPYPLVCVTGCVMIHNDFAFRARVPFTTPHILIPPSQPLAVC